MSHSQKREHSPILEQLDELPKLLSRSQCSLKLDECPVPTYNKIYRSASMKYPESWSGQRLTRRENSPGRDDTSEHDDHECEIDSGGDARKG